MINELLVRQLNAYTGQTWKEIELSFEHSAEYKIRRIDGLGPVKTEVNLMPHATEAGSQYISSRDIVRNILMKIEFNPNYAAGSTVTKLRRELTDILSPGDEVELELDVDTVGLQQPGADPIGNLFIKGVVESNEPDIFAAETSNAISILSYEPYFELRNYEDTHSFLSGRDMVVTYNGTAPIGFVFSFNVTTASPSGWFLQGTAKNDYFGVASPMEQGDRFIVSTVKGSRYVHRVRGGSTTSVLGYMTGSLNDMRLYPGDNHFEFSVPGITSAREITHGFRFKGL